MKKADILSRMKKNLVSRAGRFETGGSCSVSGDLELSRLHAMHHMGVDRTLYFAHVTRQSIQNVVKNCESIDLSLGVHKQGNISAEHNWK